MRGHIRKRGKGSWSVIIDAGRTPEGKRKQKWITVRGTKKEAEARLTKILNSQHEGTYVEPSKITLGEYLEDWLKHIETQGYARRTLINYTHICRKHIIPSIGHVPLQKLHGTQIESYYAEALKGGRRQAEGGLSAKTVLDHHRALSMALKKAVRQNLIVRNPCADADPPKAEKYSALALEEKEIRALLKAADGSPLYPPILLALCTGLRKGEVMGLKWSDQDGDSLHISRTLSQTAHGIELKAPKTKKSNRVITLPRVAMDMLKKHRVEQAKTKLAMGPGYKDEGLIFAREDGAPWKPTSFDGMFSRLLRDAALWKLRPELERLRYHDLRHTHATQLLKAGENIKVVSERLGHATITITLETYAHVLPNMQAEAARKCDALMQKVIG